MRRKTFFFKIFLYSVLAILGFIAGSQISAYINHKKRQNSTDMAYCLTLQDYLTKAANKDIETLNGKSALYVMGGLLNSKKKIFEKTCPDIYREALIVYKNESKKALK